MRRLALVLYAGVALPLLAGCPTSPCESTLEVRWALKDVNGATITCDQQAPVATTVRVIVDGALVDTLACSAGAATVFGVAPGAHQVTVEGLDAGRVLQYRDWTDVTVGQCAAAAASLTPGRGTVRIAYATASGTCQLPGASPLDTGAMWFQVREDAYGIDWFTVDETTAATRSTYLCGNWGGATPEVAPIRFSVPYGTYTLEWIKEVFRPDQQPPTRRDLYVQCTPTPFTVRSPDFLDVPVTLDPVTGTTPACPP